MKERSEYETTAKETTVIAAEKRVSIKDNFLKNKKQLGASEGLKVSEMMNATAASSGSNGKSVF